MAPRTKPLTLPFPVLVGDIGGTNARFAQLDAPDAELHIFPTAATAEHESPVEAIETVVFAAEKDRPKTLIFALILLNDFEAQALALPSLKTADLRKIGGGETVEEAPMVVIGPGTGLGVCILAHAEGLWIPIPGEGGHVSLAAETDRDIEIWRHMAGVEGRVTAESAISGPGMLHLYKAIAAANGHAPKLETPADITGAVGSDDPDVRETLALFGKHLGALAGDFALTALARGGVYIGGGVALHIADTLQSGPFRAAFEAKPPHRKIVASIPTFLITHQMPALVGLAAYAGHPDAYGVDLTGRHWTV
jgi:glucokinase